MSRLAFEVDHRNCVPIRRRSKLEITESMLMGDAPEILDVLADFRALGVGIAIDDFGTGYSSSLSERFCVSNLKIDRSFIRDVATNKDDAIITWRSSTWRGIWESMSSRGRGTLEQRDFLLREGCHLMQGLFLQPSCPRTAYRATAGPRESVPFQAAGP